MPCREITQVVIDHLRCIIKFLFRHALLFRDCLSLFERSNYSTAIAPAMEVAAVEGKHFAHKCEFLFPEGMGGCRREFGRGEGEKP